MINIDNMRDVMLVQSRINIVLSRMDWLAESFQVCEINNEVVGAIRISPNAFMNYLEDAGIFYMVDGISRIYDWVCPDVIEYDMHMRTCVTYEAEDNVYLYAVIDLEEFEKIASDKIKSEKS